MTAQVIESTIQTWRREPARAFSKPSVQARSQCSKAVMQSGSFTWQADLPPSLGGKNDAPSPTALMLSALAGCAVTFIKDTLAPQLGVRVYNVDATASCEADARGLVGIDSVEPDLGNIKLDLRIESPDGADAVGRLVGVWQERCPILLALLKPTKVEVNASVVDWYAAR